VRNYRELIAWQVAFQLARYIYLQTEKFPKEETFGLRIQMRRAAVSIASNIAEGAGRSTKKDFAQFVVIARGSLNELETQYLLAESLGYLAKGDEIEAQMERLFGLLNGLRNSLNAERSTLNAER
jgi:four helix bundle protein